MKITTQAEAKEFIERLIPVVQEARSIVLEGLDVTDEDDTELVTVFANIGNPWLFPLPGKVGILESLLFMEAKETVTRENVNHILFMCEKTPLVGLSWIIAYEGDLLPTSTEFMIATKGEWS